MTPVELDPSALKSSVAFTGRLACMTRAEAFAVVRGRGGTPSQTVTKRTNLLIVGELGWPLLDDGRPSNKLSRASAYGVPVVSERPFLEWIGKPVPDSVHKTYSADQLDQADQDDDSPDRVLHRLHCIAGVQDMRKIGRIGIKALIYFEVVTTAALIVGLIIVNVWRPGVGMNVDPASLDPKLVAAYVTRAGDQSTVGFLLNIIPNSIVGAFVSGNVLEVLFFSILFAIALHMLGGRGQYVLQLVDGLSAVLFKLLDIIMKASPLGVFGAMAFTVGKFGVGTVLSLAQFMATFYVACVLFILLVLGLIARLCGFRITRLVRYLKEELLLVFGFSTSEPVLPRFIEKMERLGCSKSVVGLVIPTGYSFNLDGTCIYLTMALVFLAQATNTHLTLWEQIGSLFVLLLTSKGAAAVQT